MRAAVDWQSGVDSAWRNIADFVPKLVIFLIILVVGWLIAKALAKVTDAVLEKVGFDRVVERGGVSAALARTPYDASSLVARLVYYAVLLIALVMAFNVWGPNPVSDLLSQLVAWLPRLFVAILIVVVAAAIARAVKDIVTAALGALSYGRVLANSASIFILGLGIIAALNQAGIATTVTTPVLIAVLATIAGVVIVGVGGGLILPMRQRWERWLAGAEAEAPRIKEHAQRHAAQRPAARADERVVTLPSDPATAAHHPRYGAGPTAPQDYPTSSTAPDYPTSSTTQAYPPGAGPSNVAYPAPPPPEQERH